MDTPREEGLSTPDKVELVRLRAANALLHSQVDEEKGRVQQSEQELNNAEDRAKRVRDKRVRDEWQGIERTHKRRRLDLENQLTEMQKEMTQLRKGPKGEPTYSASASGLSEKDVNYLKEAATRTALGSAMEA